MSTKRIGPQVAELEARFGSDEALGVYFIAEDGRHLSLEQADAYFATGKSADSFLRDGGSAVCCTDYAMYISSQLPGRVHIFGFANEKNPHCEIALRQLHPGGHDFALVDGRFIVDPWLTLVAGYGLRSVFDLADPDDAAFVRRMYGHQENWLRMSSAEECARNTINRRQA